MFVIFPRQLKERGSRKETSLASTDRAVYFKQQGGRYGGCRGEVFTGENSTTKDTLLPTAFKYRVTPRYFSPFLPYGVSGDTGNAGVRHIGDSLLFGILPSITSRSGG